MKNDNPEMSVDAVQPPAEPQFSEETKRQYAAAFLTSFPVGERKSVQATAELVQTLKRVVNLIGNGTVTVGSFVQSIVESHILEHKVLIESLREASLQSDSNPSAMDALPHEAKVYQAKYLTGDGKVRTLKGIYMNRDLVNQIKRIVFDVNGEHPTCGSYLEAIVMEHLTVCEDLISEMVNDKHRKNKI